MPAGQLGAFMQQDILSQDEIDVLIRHELGDEATDEHRQNSDTVVAIPYDFSTHGVLAWGKIPALDIIHNRFSRLFSQSLSGFIARLADVELFSSDSLTFGEFIRTLPMPASLHLFTMRPLHSAAVMAIESTLVFSIIECLFGGSGRSRIKVEGREFTAIEQRVITKVVLLALAELEKAWEPVYPVKLRLERSEVNPHLIAVVPSRDMVMVAMLEVRFEDVSGFIRICIPYGMLQPIKSTLDGSFHTTWVDADQKWTGLLRRALLRAETEVVVELGETHLDSQQFLTLQVGDVIPLHRSVHEPLLVKIQRVPKAWALPGTLNGHRAVKVTALIAQEG
jgi:flagellar motor switch protein FliM